MKRTKRFTAALTLLVVLSILSGCEQRSAYVPKEFTFSKVIANTRMLVSSSYRSYTDGVVLHKSSKDNVAVAVVTGLPLLKVDPNDLLDKDVIAIKLPDGTFDSLAIGDIVTANGTLTYAEHNGQAVYYVDASKVTVTGTMPLADPDFKAICDAVAQHENNDDGFMDVVTGWLLIEFLTGGPTGILNFDDD